MNNKNIKQISFLQRNRKRFITAAALSTVIFATGSIFLYFLKSWLYKQQLKITEQHFIREQIKRRFTQTQHDSLIVLYELLPVFVLILAKDYNLDELVIALRDKKLKKSQISAEKNATVEDGNVAGTSGSSIPGGTISEVTVDTNLPPYNLTLGDSQLESSEKYADFTKAQLWHELQLKSLVKLITISYTISSLFLLTRLQLNILTRREYLATAVNIAIEQENAKQKNNSISNSVFNWFSGFIYKSPDDNKDKLSSEGENIEAADSKTKLMYINEQAFLSTSWWILNNGYLVFSELATRKVDEYFSNYNPKDTLSLMEFSNNMSNIFHSINKELFTNNISEIETSQPINNISDIFLPEDSKIDYMLQRTMDENSLKELSSDSLILSQLLSETAEYLNDKSSIISLELLLNESFQFIMNEIENSVLSKIKKSNKKVNNETVENDATQESDIKNKKVQLALIAMAGKDCCTKMLINNNDLVPFRNTTSTQTVKNEYLKRLDTVTSLNDLSASVYGKVDF
ncbi:hypothetical protein TPHA_0D02200 [Tetrapisispora phaffii CBS 4417]|uniref:Peroxin-3 n=1 Tax=Tetrapisispora phaffii (strain ATCC 24235 / CBS 4417 / NBRC 1672 / NRRL Y-8282 / UCD 70-5) TaxID=1071381 RepID=G8BSN7_TETPH|nr:hypothetical protein TPHA_0D02200 [Tetrapisispora phaffii CBS 4417]CCE62858.1 hypothetical protein TPHA_0D02200 [Tetrapisispora phaffii CBS 4417]